MRFYKHVERKSLNTSEQEIVDIVKDDMHIVLSSSTSLNLKTELGSYDRTRLTKLRFYYS